MSQSARYWLALAAIILTVLAADQISKRLVVDNLELYEAIQPFPELTPLFQITRTANTGSAFGFLPQAGDLFLIIAVVVVSAMMYFYPRLEPGNWLVRVAVGLVVAGALGNALDRIQYGHVVDFIHYQIPQLSISNVSNLADHAIVIGVGIVFVDSWRAERKVSDETTSETETEAAD